MTRLSLIVAVLCFTATCATGGFYCYVDEHFATSNPLRLHFL